MFYPYLDWQREALAMLMGFGGLPRDPKPWAGSLAAFEVAARNLEALVAKRIPIEAVLAKDAGPGIGHEVLRSGPFGRSLLFRGHERRRRFLFIAPYSGYASAVLSPLLATLLGLGEVIVNDWSDARLVPLSAGGFGVRQQLDLALELAGTGDGLHLVGLSQSGPVALAVAARLAEAGRAPASLLLLGSQIDPRVKPRPIQRFMALCPRPLAFQLASEVPAFYAGVGRRVYPGLVQLLAFTLQRPDSYLGIQQGLWADLVRGADRGFRRQHADVHSLIDVPAEILYDMLDWAVFRPGIEGHRLRLGGEVMSLRPLAGTPVLTLEAGEDEIIGQGQTHAAQGAIGTRDPSLALTLPRLQHHMLFTAPEFDGHTAPAIRRFVEGLGNGRGGA